MTAIGKSQHCSKLGRFNFQIQSVNRKYLEINGVIPKELQQFDLDIKKWIGLQVSRGQISFKLDVAFEESSPLTVAPNLVLARQIKEAWELIARELDIQEPFQLSFLANEKHLFSYTEKTEETQVYLKLLEELVSQGLQSLVEMKDIEGRALQVDIECRLMHLSEKIDQIACFAHNSVAKTREKLRSRLEEVLPGATENEERLLREICLYAEKVDISEEITRFRSHIEQAYQLLRSSETSVGKTFDFLLQEMNREVNTIGSKAADIEISKRVVEMKGELDKIREQIQNVE